MGVVRAWQCPDCGCSWPDRPAKHYLRIIDVTKDVHCPGEPVLVFVVPASETRQGFEPGFSPDPDGGWFEVYGPLDQYEPGANPMMQIGAWKPVGVFALPEENTE